MAALAQLAAGGAVFAMIALPLAWFAADDPTRALLRRVVARVRRGAQRD